MPYILGSDSEKTIIYPCILSPVCESYQSKEFYLYFRDMVLESDLEGCFFVDDIENEQIKQIATKIRDNMDEWEEDEFYKFINESKEILSKIHPILIESIVDDYGEMFGENYYDKIGTLYIDLCTYQYVYDVKKIIEKFMNKNFCIIYVDK